MARKPKRLTKAELLEKWKGLKRKRPLRPRPVPYKHKGSTFDQDGIRITGTRQFVDAILSRLTEFLEYENEIVRLQVSYSQSTDKEGNPLTAWKCYIQVHERGGEAQMTNLFMAAVTGKVKSGIVSSAEIQAHPTKSLAPGVRAILNTLFDNSGRLTDWSKYEGKRN